MASLMQVCMISKAIYVDLPRWKPNWVGDNRAEIKISIVAINISRILEKYGSTKIGLQLEIKIFGPNLKCGVILSIFRLLGIKPELNEEFKIHAKWVATKEIEDLAMERFMT